MIKNKIFRYFFYSLLAVSILLGLNIASRRVQYENSQKNVSITLTLRDLKELALYAGTDIDSLLSIITKKTKVSKIILHEATLKDFVDSGKISLLKGSEVMEMMRVGYINRATINRLYNSIRIDPDHFYILIDEEQDFDQIKNFLILEFGEKRVKQIDSYLILSVVDDLDDLLTVGMGFLPESLDLIKKHGFTPIYSIKNSNRLSEKLVKQKLSELSGLLPGSMILFDDKSVLGYPGYLDIVGARLVEKRISVGDIEFYRKKGFATLSSSLGHSVYRAHDIPFDIVQKGERKIIIDRYVRAAKERGNRVLIVHPFLTFHDSSIPIIEYNISFLKRLATKIEKNGMTLTAKDQAYRVSYKPVTTLELLFFSFVVATILLVFINVFRPISLSFFSLYYVMAIISFYGLYYIFGYFAYVKAMAFLSAISCPTYAMISQFPQKVNDENFRVKLGQCLIYLLKLTGITLVGALYIVVFLSHPSFLKGIHQFLGVKFAFLIPLVLIGLFFYLRPHRITSVFYVLRRLFYAPVRTAGLISVFALILFTLVLILRSGNFTFLTIYNFEIEMRSFVESLFYVRPRTKEFLIGYPFLVLTYLFVDSRISRVWVWFFNIMGSIALLSIVNSFSHIHTPLLVSVYRTITGMILGIVIAFVYMFIMKLVSRFSKQRLM
jgi:hypothetical protein